MKNTNQFFNRKNKCTNKFYVLTIKRALRNMSGSCEFRFENCLKNYWPLFILPHKWNLPKKKFCLILFFCVFSYSLIIQRAELKPPKHACSKLRTIFPTNFCQSLVQFELWVKCFFIIANITITSENQETYNRE